MLNTGICEASQRTNLRKRFVFKLNFFCCFYLGMILPHASSSVQFTGLKIICAGSMEGVRGNDKWPRPGKGVTSLYRNAAQANETVPPLNAKCPSATSYLEIYQFRSSPYWPLQKEPKTKQNKSKTHTQINQTNTPEN